MQSSDLTREQLDELHAKLWPMLNYLGRLQKRIDAERFPADDPLRRDVMAAFDKMQAPAMTVHYLGCSGVGRK